MNKEDLIEEKIGRFNHVNNQLLFHKFIMINEILDKRNKKQNPAMKSVTKGQGRLIIFLKRKDRLSTKELSEILNISVTSLNETLNKLEQQNFIRKVPSEQDKRILLVELTEEGRTLEFKNHEDIDIFDSLSAEEKENLNEYLNHLTLALHKKFKNENPEKYEKIIKNRKEIFEKYFKDENHNDEWLELINCEKKIKNGDNMNIKNYPNEPTDEAKVDSTLYDCELIGENELGTVHLHGPFGNAESNIKIAYLIGMHPLESKAHRALFDTILDENDNLNHAYYIYNINVLGELDEATEGRMDGQLLAQEFVAPHIINGDYDFLADIHSNKGLKGPGTYEKTNFLFAPGFDGESEKILEVLLSEIGELCYYAPEYRTSPEFITVPVQKSGTPTLVYETYSYEPIELTYKLSEKLVNAIDNLVF